MATLGEVIVTPLVTTTLGPFPVGVALMVVPVLLHRSPLVVVIGLGDSLVSRRKHASYKAGPPYQ